MFINVANPILATPAAAQSCANGAVPCLQALGYLPGASSLANRYSSASVVSADGNVVAGIARNASGQDEGFRWVGGVMQGLGKLSGTYGVCANGSCSVPKALNADGSVVVGLGYVAEPAGPDFSGRPFIWSNGTMQEITPPCSPRSPYDSGEASGVSANASTIVGSFNCSSRNSGSQAFRQSSGTTSLLSFLPTYNSSVASGVSADGSVIVGSNNVYSVATTPVRPVRWSNSSVTDLGLTSGDTAGAATAISADAGTIVGATGNKAMRWSAGRVGDLDGLSGGNAVAVSGDGSVILRGGGIWMGRTGTRGGFELLLAKYGVDTSQFTGTMGVVSVSADGRTFVGTAAHIDGKSQGFIARIPLPPVTRDFDSSSKSDILWRNSAGDNAMWLMNGATISSVAGLVNVTTNWTPVGQRDFNGDGKSDILWRDTSGNAAIWLMNGSTILSVASFGNVGANWTVAGTADFNGDGKGDILWRSTAGDNAIWFMNGTTLSSIAVVGNVPTNWSVAGTADFNADGKGDILWRNAAGDNAIWLMNGSTISSVAGLGNVPTNWSIVGTADFDGDGKGDIIWHNSGGDNAIWLMNGTTIASVAGLGNIPTNWSIVSNGDYNGDGNGDILWRNSAGDNAIWFMSGTTLSSISGLGNVPTNWTIQNFAAN